MFPSASIRRLADALLEAADAALSPDSRSARECRDARRGTGALAKPPVAAAALPPATDHARHPHRRQLRIQRVRRHGAAVARPQHCISPVSRATAGHEPRRPASQQHSQ